MLYVSGTVLNHVVEKTAIPAQEKTILWTMPKTMKTPLSQPPNRRNGMMGESALANRPRTKTRRIATTFRSPRTRLASVTKISSCLKSPPNRNALSVS